MSLLDDIIARVTGGSAGGGGAAAASIPGFAGGGGGSGAGGPGGLLTSISGFGGAPTGGTQGNIEGGLNTALRIGSLIPGPQQPFVDIAAALAPFIESLFGPGVPREAKTQAVGGALSGSGNPIDQIVGQYVNQGVGQGNHVLSESSPKNFELGTERLAAMLESLTGQQGTNVTGTGSQFKGGVNFNLPQLGQLPFQLPSGYNFLGSDPQSLQKASQDIQGQQGFGATDIFGPNAQQEWQKVVQELISQGALTKYGGPTGSVGGSNVSPTGTSSAAPGGASASAIPNIMLPHPLAPNPANAVPSPYPTGY